MAWPLLNCLMKLSTEVCKLRTLRPWKHSILKEKKQQLCQLRKRIHPPVDPHTVCLLIYIKALSDGERSFIILHSKGDWERTWSGPCFFKHLEWRWIQHFITFQGSQPRPKCQLSVCVRVCVCLCARVCVCVLEEVDFSILVSCVLAADSFFSEPTCPILTPSRVT